MNTLSTPYGRVAYRERGNGMPIVLLHGNGHDHHDFDEVAGTLSQQYRTIAIDWPGCGATPPPRPPSSASAVGWAVLLEAIVAEMNLEPAIFLGHSVGGFASARLALRQPQRVRRLILVAPGGFSSDTRFSRFFCRFMGTEPVVRALKTSFARYYMKERTPEVAAILGRLAARLHDPASIAVIAAIWRSFNAKGHDLRSQAAAITVPTLTILGRRDPIIRPPDVAANLRRIPQNKMVVMDTGHAVYAEAPQQFLVVVKRFVTQETPALAAF